MPKSKINDYIFYKIVCLDNSCELCYVGSTVNWKARQRSHKSNCYNENGKKYNYKVYKTIRANDGWDNFKMIQIGTRPQLTVRQAEEIEDEYRVELKATMNVRRCYLTEDQKRERDKEYKEEYYKNNIEAIKANASQKIVCECGCDSTRNHLERHKKSKKHIRLMLG